MSLFFRTSPLGLPCPPSSGSPARSGTAPREAECFSLHALLPTKLRLPFGAHGGLQVKSRSRLTYYLGEAYL